MKERPIIFSSDSVKAILEKRKTMTRRVIKPQPEINPEGLLIKPRPNYLRDGYGPRTIDDLKCPYGQIRDHLWTKEAWADKIPGCPNGLSYMADHCDPEGDGPANPMKWKSARFMPRWASRITLEITNIRVERLQDISADDVEAEGIDVASSLPIFLPKKLSREKLDGLANHIARELFRPLWDSLHKKDGFEWATNCYVWVIEFKRILT